MIKWLKRLFGIKDDLEKKYTDLLKNHIELLNVRQYTVLTKFDISDREFIRKISTVQEMEEMKFMLFDMKQKYIDMMVEGDVGGNLQVQKAFYILKGISMVERNLNEYKAQWNQIVNMESQNVEV
jgi:hypothetical protein